MRFQRSFPGRSCSSNPTKERLFSNTDPYVPAKPHCSHTLRCCWPGLPCSISVATPIAESTGEDEMLRYLDDAERADADAKYWREAYGSKVLY